MGWTPPGQWAKKFGKITNDEDTMVSVQLLKAVREIDKKLMGINNSVKAVQDREC